MCIHLYIQWEHDLYSENIMLNALTLDRGDLGENDVKTILIELYYCVVFSIFLTFVNSRLISAVFFLSNDYWKLICFPLIKIVNMHYFSDPLSRQTEQVEDDGIVRQMLFFNADISYSIIIYSIISELSASIIAKVVNVPGLLHLMQHFSSNVSFGA